MIFLAAYLIANREDVGEKGWYPLLFTLGSISLVTSFDNIMRNCKLLEQLFKLLHKCSHLLHYNFMMILNIDEELCLYVRIHLRFATEAFFDINPQLWAFWNEWWAPFTSSAYIWVLYTHLRLVIARPWLKLCLFYKSLNPTVKKNQKMLLAES